MGTLARFVEVEVGGTLGPGWLSMPCARRKFLGGMAHKGRNLSQTLWQGPGKCATARPLWKAEPKRLEASLKAVASGAQEEPKKKKEKASRQHVAP